MHGFFDRPTRPGDLALVAGRVSIAVGRGAQLGQRGICELFTYCCEPVAKIRHHRWTSYFHPVTPTTAREWVSIEDPEEDRVWMFDVTFLTSRWTCIFGNGCQGVLTEPAPELVQGCCSYGAHFTDEEDITRVTAAAKTLTAEQWQFKEQGKKGIIKRKKSGEVVSRLVDDACIFLNRPDFEKGAGCAFHVAAMERGIPHAELKPDVCWQLPLRRFDEVDETTKRVTSTVTEWSRDHWGEGGEEFAWWCTEAPEAFVGHQAVYRELKPELIGIAGDVVYTELAGYLDRREGGGTPLPHPTRRN